MKIYVASSWRNTHQPEVVSLLRQDGHDVYDFREDGFSWSAVDPDWQAWPKEAAVGRYFVALAHPTSIKGYRRDMDALADCDACVMVMPCGPSASLELGYAAGRGCYTVVYVPEFREPELMVRMANLITDNMLAMRAHLNAYGALLASSDTPLQDDQQQPVIQLRD